LYIVDGTGNSFIPAPSDLSELENRALQTLLPLVKAEISLPNFLLELKDLRPTISVIKKLFTASDFIATVGKLLIPRNISFASLLRTAAGQYLNLQFNILPLISDIGKIYLALKRTEARLNDFVTRAGRVQSRHFRFAWSEFPDIDNPWSWSGRIAQDARTILSETGASRQVYYDPSIFHAQLQYNYNYTGYQAEHARLLGWLDALGINLNPAIIWNALPWSFVVDWVLGIGPYLDTLKITNMEPQINIRRYLWSITRRRRIFVHTGIRIASGENRFAEHRQTLPTVVQTAYRRTVTGLPVSSIESSGLTLKEVSLGAALVIARKR
jgi:hypothetical protein